MARETFTSLKATHYAHRMAGDILYDQPLPLENTCPRCGRDFQLKIVDRDSPPTCAHCNSPIQVPPHILARAREIEAKRSEEEMMALDIALREEKRSAEVAKNAMRSFLIILISIAGLTFAITIIGFLLSSRH